MSPLAGALAWVGCLTALPEERTTLPHGAFEYSASNSAVVRWAAFAGRSARVPVCVGIASCPATASVQARTKVSAASAAELLRIASAPPSGYALSDARSGAGARWRQGGYL